MYNPNCFCFSKISSEKAALEMTTNEEEDDDNIDFDEEEELLRRDADRLLEEIAFLEETSSSSLRNDVDLESRLETLERERVNIARRMTTMMKKKKKQSDDDDNTNTTAFSLLSSRIHEVAEYVDSAVRNTVVSNQRKREENILRELDAFVDGDEASVETNTIRAKEVDEEKENRVEWIRKFGIENSMMMIGGKMDEDLNAERSLRAFEMNDDEKGGVVKSGKGKEKGVVFLDDDFRRAKEEEDLEKAIEKNVLSTVDLAIKRLETASAAIAKATSKNSKETGGAAGTAMFATAISNFSALPVWQKRVVGVLAFLGFSWILILNAMNNDEKSEFEEIDQSIATTANAS